MPPQASPRKGSMENNDYKDYKPDLKSPEGRKAFIEVMAGYGKEFVEKGGKVFHVYADGSLYPVGVNLSPPNPDAWENEPSEDSVERFEAYYAEHKEEEDDRTFAWFASRGWVPADLPDPEDQKEYQKWLDDKLARGGV